MDIQDKKEALQKLRASLKAKFVGIDKQIDMILDRITFWYLRPDKLERPLIINLWGPTGVGKTDLLREIKNHLGIQDSYQEVLMSNEEGSTLLIDLLEEGPAKLSQGSHGILVLDEFQRYRTKGPDGIALRGLPFQDLWQILSDGKIIREVEAHDLVSLLQSFRWEVGKVGPQLTKVIKIADEDSDDDSDENDEPSSIMNETLDALRLIQGTIDSTKIEQLRENMDPGIQSLLQQSFTFKDPNSVYYYKNVRDSYAIHYVMTAVKNYLNARILLQQRGVQVGPYLEDTLEAVSSFLAKEGTFSGNYEITYDLSKTLVFIVGNLDDIYKEALHTDSPFIPADHYRSWSNDISIYSVKDKLSDLFFPEQVARFGNIHIVYPTLGNVHYETLVERGLISIARRLEGLFPGVEVWLTSGSMKSFVYRNGVYPIQGVRPLFTSLQELESLLLNALYSSFPTKLLSQIEKPGESEENPRVLRIDYNWDKYHLDRCCFVYTVAPKDMVQGISHDGILFPYVGNRDRVTLAMLSKSDFLGYQAVHEAGHILAAWILAGEVPDFAVFEEKGAFTVVVDTRADSEGALFSSAVIALAGIAATDLCFGQDNIWGHTDDLKKATRFLTGYYRKCGFGYKKRFLGVPYRILGEEEIKNDQVVKPFEVDAKKIQKHFNKAYKQARDLVKRHRYIIEQLANTFTQELYISKEQIKDVLCRVDTQATTKFRNWSFTDKAISD